jgi:MFS transporter, putative metabolite:H+ symporter
MLDATRPARTPLAPRVRLLVVVAALGYFVDIYDLLLFNIVRLKSLADLGITGEAALEQGIFLINMQMGGLLAGGVLWGILADRRGRLSVLFGSILLYSLANIANGLVQSIEAYAVLRLVAGVGLAGELGAGITLVSESMPRESRGYGTMIVAGVGILGAVVGALVGDAFRWRTAFFIGGGLGLFLLALRVGVYESGLFEQVRQKSSVARGHFLKLFARPDRARRYFAVILVGVPIWFTVAILISLSPELGRAMGMATPPSPGRAVMFCYLGLAMGDFSSGALSQFLRSRKKAILAFLVMTALSIGAYFVFAAASLTAFYVMATVLGFSTGYWAVFVTIAAEQFGTNLRGTATTTVPNFVRGAVVPVTALFRALKPSLGIVGGAGAVGALTLVLAFAALFALDETYGKDLDFLED